MRFAAITALFMAAPLLATTGLPTPALAEGEQAGAFDYYVLALSWSPGWCATEGLGQDAAQCRAGRRTAFVLHGLWPQNEVGWPSDCRTSARDPAREQSAAMTDIMGSNGAAWYQWQKHGRCSGLSARDYFATARAAYGAITIPQALRNLDQDVKLPARVVEEAFLEANPKLAPDMITVTCNNARIDEVRICLTKDLEPRRCGADTLRDCRMPDALLERPR